MTITIELTDEQEARLRALAAAAGQTIEEYAVALIVRHLDELKAREDAQGEMTEQAMWKKYAVPQESLEDRKGRIYALMGSSAHLGPSHIMEDRAEEVAREEQAFQERQRK